LDSFNKEINILLTYRKVCSKLDREFIGG
jgi:hypothetical protein